MRKNIAVLGAGSWGTALSKVLCENGHHVTLWGNNTETLDQMNQQHINEEYLPHVELPKELIATDDLQKALTGTEIILFVVPTKAIRPVAQQVNKLLNQLNKPLIIHASKGLEQGTHLRISQVLEEVLDKNLYQDIVVLSGPSHAEEVARKDLTTITAACQNETAAQMVQDLFMNYYFRVYTNTDVVGVELGAALKNVIAIGAGVIAGLGYGDNAKAALITRGLAEITRYGVRFGAEVNTFSGLSGVGDLIVTCTSIHSRNWQLGHLIGSGETLQEAMDSVHMSVEGVWTAKVVHEIAKEKGIDMPMTTAIYNIIYHQKSVQQTIDELMMRHGKSENI